VGHRAPCIAGHAGGRSVRADAEAKASLQAMRIPMYVQPTETSGRHDCLPNAMICALVDAGVLRWLSHEERDRWCLHARTAPYTHSDANFRPVNRDAAGNAVMVAATWPFLESEKHVGPLWCFYRGNLPLDMWRIEAARIAPSWATITRSDYHDGALRGLGPEALAALQPPSPEVVLQVYRNTASHYFGCHYEWIPG